jgi:hypothetical protein
MRDDDELEDAQDRAVVAKLRALPPEGTEPDWHELEAAIRAEVGDDAPRPWWRNWRWIVPVWALATTAVVALLVLRSDEPAQPPATTQGDEPRDAGVAAIVAPVAPSAQQPTALWLDGQVVELDDISGASLDALDDEARAALGPEDDVTGGILPVADYGWIDTLDDDAVARADEWLKRKKS